MGGPEQEEADRQFHTTIAEVTGNTALIFTINNLWNMRSEAMKAGSAAQGVRKPLALSARRLTHQ